MKRISQILAFVFIITLAACATSTERGKIVQTINQGFAAVDSRNWDHLNKFFAPSVRLDYSSFGQKAEDTTPQKIIKAWRGFLPGFDSTHHQLGTFTITENGNKASASFYGTAGHYINGAAGGEVWTVAGTYDLELSKQAGSYQVTKMKFNFKYMTGNVKLPAAALKKMQTQTKNNNKSK